MVNVINCRNIWSCLDGCNEILNGFSILMPSIITVIAYILSTVFLAFVLKNLLLGMAYVIWLAFGIIGTAILGVLLFHEKLTLLQILSIILIIIGIIGLKLFSKQ